MFRMKFSLVVSLCVITLYQLQSVSARPKSWREGPIVDPGVFVITQIKECRNRMGYCILGTSCSVDSDFVRDDMGGHCNRLSEAFSPRATFVCCKQNPALFENDLEAVILEQNLSHNTSVSTTDEEEDMEEQDEENPGPSSEPALISLPSSSAVTELYTETEVYTDTTVEDITKVITSIVTELVNVTELPEAPHQHELSTKLDFSTGSFTTEKAHNSFLPSLGGSILSSLPPVQEAGPWIEKPPVVEAGPWQEKTSVPVWEDLETIDKEEEVEVDGELTEYSEWSDREGEVEVYEIEIEQSLPAFQESAEVSGSILRPGLVIDDPSLIQSIVTGIQGDQVEDPEEQMAVGTIEEVPVIEYSDYFPISPYQEESDSFQFDPSDNIVNTEYIDDEPPKSEPEIHCDLSILLSGISCTFNILDNEPSPETPFEIIEESEQEISDEENNLENFSFLDAFPPSPVESLEPSEVKPAPLQETAVKVEDNPPPPDSSEDLDDSTSNTEPANSTRQKEEPLKDVDLDPKISNISDHQDEEMEDSKEVRHVSHELQELGDNADILQLLIDQLQELDNLNKPEIIESKPTVETIIEAEETAVTTTSTTTTTAIQQPIKVSTTSTASKPKVCGLKGGQYVEKSYGKAATKYILPLLIDSWVFGKDPVQRARYDDTEGRISGGKVTSTVLYCWVAAILTRDTGEFVCTGTLVAEDLVITSGSCIDFLFKRGLSEFKVVLGDSNLKLELPYGVQEHDIDKAVVHENYDINDSLHQNDIGFVLLRSPAQLEDAVCLLCLPRPGVAVDQESCTVTGYGRPVVNTGEGELPRGAAYWEDKTSDGILREAQLDIISSSQCASYLGLSDKQPSSSSSFLSNTLCAKNDVGETDQSACFLGLDGGSPLACEAEGHHYLGGVVIFSTVCGGNQPSVFIKVSHYVEWILNNYAALRLQ